MPEKQRKCPHCSELHPAEAVFCPTTGRAVQPKRKLGCLPKIIIASTVLFGLGLIAFIGWYVFLANPSGGGFSFGIDVEATGTRIAEDFFRTQTAEAPEETPTIEMTEAPSPLALGGCTPAPGYLFQDDFSDESCGWEDIFRDASGISDYDQGGFRLLVQQEQYDYWANPNVSFSDVVIEVDARKIGGPEDNDFGVICRYVNALNFYFFIIASDGYYAIGKSVDGDYEYIGSGTMQPTIFVNGGDATNHIRADCVGNTLRLYANGNLLHEVTDSTFTTGDVGLIAGTFDAAGTDILFDNFVVRAP